MKIKPKDVSVNLPIVLAFDPSSSDSIELFASHINAILHGKVRLKYEYLGDLGGNSMAIFYLQRNSEFSELREQFMEI